jgi:photosystem II stability/assembly factor-like uncharacterized protein
MNKSRLVKVLLSTLISLTILILSLVLLMHLFPGSQIAYAGDNLWTWASVCAAGAQIVTDPLNPGAVYARGDPNRIMKSLDGGNTWVNVAKSDWTEVSSISMASSAPNVLYAATRSGVYRTTNGGTTWQLAHSATFVTDVAISPVDWREAYLVNGGFPPNGTAPISKTTDGGQTWTDVSTGLPSSPGSLWKIFIAPSAPHILITMPWNTSPGSLYKSIDRGQSWSQMTGVPSNINTIVFDPKNSNTIYVGTLFSLAWKSTDGGNTWQPLANGLQPSAQGFVIDPDNTQVIHAADSSAGVLESAMVAHPGHPSTQASKGCSFKALLSRHVIRS